jgi:hypothetical protein
MNRPLLLLSLTLGWQLTAWGQTCDQIKKTCKDACTLAFSDSRRVKSCEIACYQQHACFGGGGGGGGGVDLPHPEWDVVGSEDGIDTNGFLVDPVWRWQTLLQTPDPGTLADPCDECPCVGDSILGVSDHTPLWIGYCTTQKIHQNSNGLCSIKIDSSIDSGLAYHMNWVPVVYVGSLRYEDHSNPAADDDYNFDISRPRLELLTKNRGDLHIEFDARETVDKWDGTGTWWESFHHNIVDKMDKFPVQKWFDTKSATVVGMLGLDLAHVDHHSELHPVYVMFIKNPEIPPGFAPPSGRLQTAADHWAFFARNWGNEGFCDGDQEKIPEEEIEVQLPDREVLAQNIWWYTHGGDSKICKNAQVTIDPNGLVRFFLGPPDEQCGLVGDLWMRPRLASEQAARTTGTPAAVPERDREDEDPVLTARIAKLNQSDRQLLYKQLSDLTSEPRSKPTKGRTELRKLSHPLPRVRRSQVTAKDFKAVADPASRAREAKKRQHIDAFLKAHGID